MSIFGLILSCVVFILLAATFPLLTEASDDQIASRITFLTFFGVCILFFISLAIHHFRKIGGQCEKKNEMVNRKIVSHRQLPRKYSKNRQYKSDQESIDQESIDQESIDQESIDQESIDFVESGTEDSI